jgi:hypothetical protein
MIEHWVDRFVGQPYSVERDCYFWFREIQREVFGRDVPFLGVGGPRVAARLMRGDYPMSIGWGPTDSPRDGDAVFLSQSKKINTHIGVACIIRGRLMVVHALKDLGVIVSDAHGLRANGLAVKGYWSPG